MNARPPDLRRFSPPPLAYPGLSPEATARARVMTGLEQAIPNVVIDTDCVLRVKLTDACGNTCWFCHNEGTLVAGSEEGRRGLAAQRQSIYQVSARGEALFSPGAIASTEEYRRALGYLARECDIDELHYSGGEPTLNRELVGLVECGVQAGMKVKATSNGERGAALIGELAAAGLSKVNYSIYGLDEKWFLASQSPNFPYRLASLRIVKLKEAMQAALQTNMSVAANMVVTPEKSYEHISRVLDEIDPRIVVRFQPELRQQELGMAAIRAALSKLGAFPILETISCGSSNRYITYALPDGRQVVMKHFRRSRLDVAGVCGGCAIDAEGKCDEGYYGLRLYADRLNQLWLGVCMQRMELNQPLADIYNGQARLGDVPFSGRTIVEAAGDDRVGVVEKLLESRGDSLRSITIKRAGYRDVVLEPGGPEIYDAGHPDIVDYQHGRPINSNVDTILAERDAHYRHQAKMARRSRQ